MRETVTFLIIQLLVLSSALIVSGKPYLKDFRPEIISEKPGVQDVLTILMYVVVLTLILLVLKFLGLLHLRLFIDASVFIAAYFYAAILTNNALISFLFAVLVVVLRQANNLLLFNATSCIAIAACSMLFGLFIPPDMVLILLAGMSIYDVVGVLYTKHIKYIWIDDAIKTPSSSIKNAVGETNPESKNTNQREMKKQALDAKRMEQKIVPSWRNTLALIFPEGDSTMAIVGSGDFAMPALLTVSVTVAGGLLAGLVCLVLSSAGFLALHVFSESSPTSRQTGLPGIPLLALSCIIAVMISRLFGLLPAG